MQQASTWERAAPLTNEQQTSIEALSSVCTQRPLPIHLTDPALAAPTPTSAAAAAAAAQQQPFAPASQPPTTAIDTISSPPGRTESVELSFSGTSFEDVVLQNSSEFYKWLSVLEVARAAESESKFQQHAAVLDAHLASCDELLNTIDEVLELFVALREGQRAVSDRTASLHVTCEHLVNEREALVAAADALRSKLAYFDELEKVAAEFHAASLSLESTAAVMAALQRVDESLAFVSSHPHYADAAAYNVKFRQLQSRALAAVKARVQQTLKSAAATVVSTLPPPLAPSTAADAVNNSTNTKNGVGETGAETTLLYVRFRAIVEPALKPIFQGIESRAMTGTNPEYARLLQDCEKIHRDTRLSLMRGPVATHLASLSGQPLPAVLRSGTAFLLHVAQLETQLFEQLFPLSAKQHHQHNNNVTAVGGGGRVPTTNQALGPLMDPLCMLLYDVMRPALVALRDIDVLCELAYVLCTEILQQQQQQGQQQGNGALLHPVLGRMLGDIQERLTYRAQAFIRENVAGFVPTPEELKYPDILLVLDDKKDGTDDSTAVEGEETALLSQQQQEKKERPSSESYHGWYPPVQRSLLLLSKLYRTIPQKAFNGLAHEAVAAAANAVVDAARAITATSGSIHGQLFTIRQLLILREQIAPFEADFAVVERSLDFSHVKDYLRRTLSGQLPLFSFSSNNAVLQLVSRGGPRLSENQVDAKKDLERQLKTACEGFILTVTKVAVDPALTFLTKVTAIKLATGMGSGSGGSNKDEEATPLRNQAFASPDRVVEVATALMAALRGPLPEAAAALRAYLPAEETRTALFKPIKGNVIEAHGQLRRLLVEEGYEAGDVGRAGLCGGEELEALLDGMMVH